MADEVGSGDVGEWGSKRRRKLGKRLGRGGQGGRKPIPRGLGARARAGGVGIRVTWGGNGGLAQLG
uniref:Uncharacterized protein n=1 Tax=Oryza sativa subsp. japonica TaxID=39947 RepID=Q6EPL3_ORYSJ|nr:hypothetical protein [Oryza sativa Japonica Group]